MKTLFLILIFFFSISAYSQKKEEIDCFELLKRYEEPWLNDSLGTNGFRSMFYNIFRGTCRVCNLNGLSYEMVKSVIGKPNSESEDIKTYWLGSDDGTYWWSIMMLYIDIETGLIRRTVVTH